MTTSYKPVPETTQHEMHDVEPHRKGKICLNCGHVPPTSGISDSPADVAAFGIGVELASGADCNLGLGRWAQHIHPHYHVDNNLLPYNPDWMTLQVYQTLLQNIDH